METIFVAIASMDDTETVPTIKNLFEAAEHPDRIRVGVAISERYKTTYKAVKKAFGKDSRVDISYHKVVFNDISTLGVGKGRAAALAFYREEDYVLQVDSHTMLLEKWDTTLIKWHKEAVEETSNEKTILTSYVNIYHYNPTRQEKEGSSVNFYPFYLPGETWLGRLPKWSDQLLPMEYPRRMYPCVKFCAAFAFGNKHFGRNPGTFVEALFYEEELVQSINLVHAGFSLVFPNIYRLPVLHLHGDHRNKHGGKRVFFTDYVDAETNLKISDTVVENYFKFLDDPKNQAAIHKYEQYARINLRFGAISHLFIPKKYSR